MKNLFKTVINSGGFELDNMLKKINTFWVQGSINEEEKLELEELAREKATFKNSVDILAKLNDLELRVAALEKSGVQSGDSSTIGEYVEGKWYYKDDKVSFEGKNYICIAPEGTVCVWSPSSYPVYWQEI